MYIPMLKSCDLTAVNASHGTAKAVPCVHRSQTVVFSRSSVSRKVQQHKRDLNGRDVVVRAAIAAPPPPEKEKVPEVSTATKVRREEAILFQGRAARRYCCGASMRSTFIL